MPNMIELGRGGSINPERVVAVVAATSAPVKRMLQTLEASRILNMTYGYPQRSVVLFENGMLAITSYTVEEMSLAVRLGKEIPQDENLPF